MIARNFLGVFLIFLFLSACGGRNSQNPVNKNLEDSIESMSGGVEDSRVTAGDLALSGAMANLALPSATGAVYVTIANGGSTGETLLGGEIPGCAAVEIHTMMMEDDVMVMRPVEGGRLEIPAGETVTLKRGGLHLMCIGKESFEIGQLVEVTLTFARAGSVSLEVLVIDPADLDSMGDMDHGDMGVGGDE